MVSRLDSAPALQRTALDPAVAHPVRSSAGGTPPGLPSRRLDRAPTVVRGGVETKVVSPAVRSLLESKKIAYAREVKFELLDSNGAAVLKGRFDVVFRNPTTNELVFPELKGDDIEALTRGQKVYVPQFESPGGARVRITSRRGGKLYLPKGTVEHVHGNNFMRVGSENLTDFTKLVEQMASGKRVTNVYLGSKGLKSFTSQEAFQAFLSENEIQVSTPAAAKAAPVDDKPLKPPDPPAGPRPPDPLHDPPAGQTPRPSAANPTAGPPRNYPLGRGSNPKPAPYDPDKPHRPTGGPEPEPSKPTSGPKPEPPKPATGPTGRVPDEPASGTGRVPDAPTVAAERVGDDAAADLAEKAAGTAAEGLTFAETVGAAFEAISPVLDVLFLAQAGYAIGKALIFHNPAEMDPDQVKLMHLMETNVIPAAIKALKAHEKKARELALRDPELDVYANVTMTISYGADGAMTRGKYPRMVYDDEQLEDAQFNSVSVGYDSKTAKKEGAETHNYAYEKDHRRRMQIITFPILLNPLGQSRGLRRWVAMRANAANAIAKGYSARGTAEGTPWVGDHMGPGGYDWTYLDDREEARREKAMAPSHRAQVELAAKVAFTEAYIDAASDHLDQPGVKKLYDDAVQYYQELKRTTIDPLYGPAIKPPQRQSFPLKPRYGPPNAPPWPPTRPWLKR